VINKLISTKGLGVGEYTCEVVYVYGGNTTASAHTSFTIFLIPWLTPTLLPPIVAIILAVVILLAFAVFLFWFFKKRKHAE
jgi:hypothetical protein